jgi:hypothetical protein
VLLAVDVAADAVLATLNLHSLARAQPTVSAIARDLALETPFAPLEVSGFTASELSAAHPLGDAGLLARGATIYWGGKRGNRENQGDCCGNEFRGHVCCSFRRDEPAHFDLVAGLEDRAVDRRI